MKDLIAAIIADLETNLGYLKQVKAINTLLNPPIEIGLPCVGVKDGDQSFESRPGRRDIETLSVSIAIYQQLFIDESGAAVMGSAKEQGDAFKGLIEIAAEIRARLNDNFFTTVAPVPHYAHVDAIAGSETLGEDDEPLMQMKVLTVSYRRFST